MTLSRQQFEKYADAAIALLEEGDTHARRLCVWIALAVTRYAEEQPSDQIRIALARVAASAAENFTGLVPLAVRVVDPVLLDASSGTIDVDIGELEELNILRRRMRSVLDRHTMPFVPNVWPLSSDMA